MSHKADSFSRCWNFGLRPPVGSSKRNEAVTCLAPHEREGQPRWVNGFYQSADESITVSEFDPEGGNDIVEAITWWERWLASKGRTPAQERELLRAETWPADEDEGAEA